MRPKPFFTALLAGFAMMVFVIPTEACWLFRHRSCAPPPPTCCPTVISVVSTPTPPPATTAPTPMPTPTPTPTPAPSPKTDTKVPHLQICLYELREAKEDVRDLKEVPDKDRDEMLGAIDAAITQLKKTITASGGTVEYIKPENRPFAKNFQHLRHATKVLKAAKEQLLAQKNVPQEEREAATAEIDKCLEQVKKSLEFIKD